MADVLFTNALIFDGSGDLPFKGEVLVQGNRISRVTRSGSGVRSAPVGGVTMVDAAGAFLMPGLVEAHTHFAWNNQPSLDAIQRMPPEEHILWCAQVAKTYLDMGWTSCVGAATAKPRLDVVIRNARWLALLGNHAYDFAISANTYFNMIRRLLGLPYWSLSRWIKLKVKNAVNFIGEFEKTLAAEGRRQQVDGVVCGHIHHPVIRDIDGLVYVNCGDWVESCTAAVEHFDGQLEIIEWTTKLPVPVVATSAEQTGARSEARQGVESL